MSRLIMWKLRLSSPQTQIKMKIDYFPLINGAKKIIASAWGLDEFQTWQVEDSKTILPNETGTLVVGQTHIPG